MNRKVSSGRKGMESMMAGLDIAANSVAITMGPKGRNVYYEDSFGSKVTNDGFTVASKIILEDKEQDAGAYVIRNLSSQQNDNCGDGTTTVSVLAQSIAHECSERPENAMVVSNSIKEASKKVLNTLGKQAIKLDKKDIKKVALISAEDEKLASLITEIIDKLGDKAVINVEDSKTFETEYEIVDGYEAHVGFMSPHFVNDKSGKAIYSDVPVLVTEKKISNLLDVKPIFEEFQKQGITQCVIVCDEIDDSMLGVFVNSKRMGSFSSVVIRASNWLLKDIEGAVGAKAISESNGITFQNFTLDHLGHAKKVVCDAHKTLFTIDGVASTKYAKILEAQIPNEHNQFQAKKMKDRVAHLRGGVAVLRVGASTDFERDYLKLKAEDSVKAVQAALEEGIVEGGGMALWRIAQDMKPKTIGEEILKKSLESPLRRIVENAGKDYTEIVLNMPQGQGYDAKNDKYVDMIEAGIIDPVKVERCAVENAVSGIATLITTEVLITTIEDAKK